MNDEMSEGTRGSDTSSWETRRVREAGNSKTKNMTIESLLGVGVKCSVGCD